MWRAYVEACVALADGLSTSARAALRQSLENEPTEHTPPEGPERPLGFRS
jgi:hypothetical protein